MAPGVAGRRSEPWRAVKEPATPPRPRSVGDLGPDKTQSSPEEPGEAALLSRGPTLS